MVLVLISDYRTYNMPCSSVCQYYVLC